MRRHTRYHSQYGYITGNGIGDLFNLSAKIFNKIPTSIIDAGKNAATKVVKSGIEATGDKVGRVLANKIAPTPNLTAPRRDILPDLKLSQQPQNPTQQGFGGRKKKIRGAGLKILI